MVPRQAVEAQNHHGLAHEKQAPRAHDPLGEMAPRAVRTHREEEQEEKGEQEAVLARNKIASHEAKGKNPK